MNDYYKNHWLDATKELHKKNEIKDNQEETLKEMLKSPDNESSNLATEILKLKIQPVLMEGLNDGQADTFVKLANFFNNPEHDAAVIKGYAGTGKTFLVKRLVEYIIMCNPQEQIAITAPTNKAVHVLSKNNPFKGKTTVFNGKKVASVDYGTIHKLLGLKESISSNGVQTFKPMSNKQFTPDIDNKQYLIVDESSMLEDQLFDQVMLYKDKLSIIFIGDPAQIPPIKKEHSKPFMEDNGFDFLKLELTEIMRQKGEHPIVDASMVLRDNLKEKNPLDGLKSKLNENADGIIAIDKVKSRSKVRGILKKYYTSDKYKDNADYVKTIAWRNVTIRSLNKIIRSFLFPDSTAMFNVGERLIANSPLFESYSFKGTDSYKMKNSTSDEFLVTEVKIVDKYIMNERFQGKFWQLTVKFNEGFRLINFIHEDSLEAYENLLDKVKAKAIETKSSKNWVRYYNILKWSDDVVYNYAITAHKSQGSTYDNVVLIEEDIDKNWNVVERNRIKYTAYTRAKHKLYTLR